ncbi:hypothetical protein [Stakelama marina]|uniref:Uncharacterized protein n=1 Tax=Stakelama marina TaxID=2826939 RepID=A0A8T4IHD5_9SPHN|nr:hypothetical protein [Stakelama marina]MBR0553970.1 hypothetical protein [Stakelama marina]
MKLIALAAALTMSAPAFAQTPPQSNPPQVSADDQSTQPGAIQYTESAGGYQPANPPMTATPTAGQPVVFKPAPQPSEAFPPPPPKASYPICKPGQYDGCRQRGGR